MPQSGCIVPSPEEKQSDRGLDMNTATHFDYMTLALQLAERGRLTVSPNPMVGCVIVKNTRIVGRGVHIRPGENHAEPNALEEAGEEARGATAYVTLEPCCHQGRTPPCTQALIRAGIKKVYVAVFDPNPLVAGKGVAELEAHGIEVIVGLCEVEAKALNEIFFHYILNKRPFVIAKWAMSLDGKTVTHPDDARQISCAESNELTHNIRQQLDAILVGAKTAVLDNPLLTARVKNSESSKQPLRIILSSEGDLPQDLKIFDAELSGKTLIATTVPIEMKNAEVLVLPKNSEGKVSLTALLDELGRRQISSLLVEGGMQVHENFFKENLVNKVSVFVAPVIIGAADKKAVLNNIKCTQLGRDF
jgi:diaminohydroxyphosphoribosylaminopyrimidine deaminase/5-amino-6-(5-phosphoribosylamino)uracil reductase